MRTVGKKIPPPGHVTQLEIQGSRMRMETVVPGMGKSQVIVDWKTGKAASIIHANRMVMEMDMKSLGESAGVQAPYCDPSEGVATCFTKQGFTQKGTETVNGYLCDVFEHKDTDGKLIRVWKPKSIPELNGVRVQVLSKEGEEIVKTDYLNLKKKDFDPKAFEVPADYIKQDMSQLMKAFMGEGRTLRRKK